MTNTKKTFCGEFYKNDNKAGNNGYVGQVFRVAKDTYRIVRFVEFSNRKVEFESADLNGSDFRQFATFCGIKFFTAK